MKRDAKRRFIAAARCPRCGALDTIYISGRDEEPRRACVNCDFSETLAEMQDADADRAPLEIKPPPKR